MPNGTKLQRMYDMPYNRKLTHLSGGHTAILLEIIIVFLGNYRVCTRHSILRASRRSAVAQLTACLKMESWVTFTVLKLTYSCPEAPIPLTQQSNSENILQKPRGSQNVDKEIRYTVTEIWDHGIRSSLQSGHTRNMSGRQRWYAGLTWLVLGDDRLEQANSVLLIFCPRDIIINAYRTSRDVIME